MIYLALGANMPSSVGSPEQTLRRVLALLPSRGVIVEAVSPFYRSPAWPDAADPPFVNVVARVRTRLPPADLMRALLQLESEFGRKRTVKNAPRTLDIDIVDYAGLVTDAPHLMLPHPRLHERAFVLRPLCDLAPDWRHPETGQTVSELLRIVGEDGLERLESAR
ncbi:MAG: 2-amino-4-hydroxy-6-hydroxymethyldihydropteridine diphosphokinase [Alphaproteobacteria bacterium]|nr:2-amino-4-hydroxy-6-hydroxymethyldihydropteridine diphosphokinase [Alphaproteobacteria bacterium]